ncbi:MAG: Hsp20/alpha crystallin family protein [Chloroflexi bacterium]|nr:Hsp20/alpha crystallin family protein [Chloroflexota bacterium]MBP7041283.1 Hsp20/alpha crystallin family protein [Chloroflexota bacterium]
MNVSETDEAIVVTAELPGLSEKDVGVPLTQDALTIKGRASKSRNMKKRVEIITGWNAALAHLGG